MIKGTRRVFAGFLGVNAPGDVSFGDGSQLVLCEYGKCLI